MNYNATAVVRYVNGETKSTYGSKNATYKNYKTVNGFLDLISENTDRNSLNVKTEKSDFVFICDCFDLTELEGKNCSLVIDNVIYDVLYIDNVMLLNNHLEIYIKKSGVKSGE